jgi:ribosomal protein S16
MLTLRFKKEGAKKKYIFRLIAIDSQRAACSGKVQEVLGWWNPKDDRAHLNKDRILFHLNHGAQCSEAVLNLLIKKGIKKGKKIAVHKKEKKEETKKELEPEETKGLKENNTEPNESIETASAENNSSVGENQTN